MDYGKSLSRGDDVTGNEAALEAVAPAVSSSEVQILGKRRLDELTRHLPPEDFNELIAIFLAEVQEVPATLRRALAAGEFDRVKEIVHKFKGSCSTVGADRLTALSLQFQHAPEPDIVNHGLGWVNQIEQEYAAVRVELGKLTMKPEAP